MHACLPAIMIYGPSSSVTKLLVFPPRAASCTNQYGGPGARIIKRSTKARFIYTTSFAGGGSRSKYKTNSGDLRFSCTSVKFAIISFLRPKWLVSMKARGFKFSHLLFYVTFLHLSNFTTRLVSITCFASHFVMQNRNG